MTIEPIPSEAPLIDPFGRAISYLRVSVTDRCDFRCVYCMDEEMTFLPKADLLTLEELERLCRAFMRVGVKKIRLTGGEPLVRRNVMWLIEQLGQTIGKDNGLAELTITTNGSQLAAKAEALYKAGVRRVNVSLDSLDKDKFRQITRWGELDKVLGGIFKAKEAGLKIKINFVAMKHVNQDEVLSMTRWCAEHGFDLVFIEVMPMGDIGTEQRIDQFWPLTQVRQSLAQHYQLEEIDYRTGGPARYFRLEESGQRIGFITPLTHNFCESCNRVRLTCTGQLYMCLGQNDDYDFRTPLRDGASDDELLEHIRQAITHKPKGHDFMIDRRRGIQGANRYMSTTGG